MRSFTEQMQERHKVVTGQELNAAPGAVAERTKKFYGQLAQATAKADPQNALSYDHRVPK